MAKILDKKLISKEKKPYIAPYTIYKIRAKYRCESSDWTAWSQTTEDPKINSLYYLDDDGEFKGRPTDPYKRAIWHALNAENKHGYDSQVIRVEPGNKQTLVYVTGVGECHIELKEAYKLFEPTGDSDN